MEPELHDGRLLSIELTPTSDTLKLVLITEAGEQVAMTISGLVRLVANNFRQGNIVFEIQLFTGSRCPPDLLKTAFDLDEATDEEQLQKTLLAATQENWTLINVGSSYGCELVAIARGPIDVSSKSSARS